VSSAIHRIMKAIYPDRFTDAPIDQVRALLGNAVEKAVIAALHERYPGRYVIPGELHYDGIYGTPDLWDIEDHPDGPATVEVKCTWASSRRAEDIEDSWFWRYWVQAKSYAKMAGMRRTVLIIVFIVGDWKSGPPIALAWEDLHTDEELDTNWDMIKANVEAEAGNNPRVEREPDGNSTKTSSSKKRGNRKYYKRKPPSKRNPPSSKPRRVR